MVLHTFFITEIMVVNNILKFPWLDHLPERLLASGRSWWKTTCFLHPENRENRIGKKYEWRKEMKKNLVIIALIAIFLLGLSALQAVEYDIVVHLNSLGPTTGYYQIPIGGGNHPLSLSAGLNIFTVNGLYPTNFFIYQQLISHPYITGTAGLGLLDPNNDNHLYYSSPQKYCQ